MTVFADFHFLRPGWLWLLPLLAFLIWQLRRPSGSLGPWRRLCEAHLLRYLSTGQGRGGFRGTLLLLAVAWLLATLALAGPVWQQRPQVLLRTLDARVLVVDLSRSMLAEDVKPNRIERALFKVADILERNDEGQIGLIAYAGESFVVSPLTRDGKTIGNMLGALSPDIMPAQGSELGEALILASRLLERVHASSGEVLVVTDAIRTDVLDRARELSERGYRISVLGVGTPAGAPIPMREGGFFKGRDGSIVVPRLDEAALRELATVGNGRYARMTADQSDLDLLLAGYIGEGPEASETLNEESRRWHEEGPWLVLLLLPLAAAAFRRGWLLAPLLVTVLPTHQAHAGVWADLWKTPDQQATAALSAGDAQRAAQLAQDELLRGNALYEAGDYQAATRAYAQRDEADAHYNRGNALAKQSRFEEALAAYDEALARQPGMEDAVHNKKLIEELLQQQEQQPEGGDRNEDQQNQQDQENDSSEDGEPSEEKTGEDGEQSDEEQQGQQQEQQEQAAENEESTERSMQPVEEDSLSAEERQAVEQWLRRIPDDPGGLLRRKFLLEYQRRGAPKPQHDEDW